MKRKIELNSKRIITAAIIFVIAAVAVLNYFSEKADRDSQPDGVSDVYFVDVGQGDSEIIKTDDGKFILIDAGPNSAENSLIAFIENMGASEFEYAVFTHPHEDHIGGGDAVLERFGAKNVIIPDCEFSSSTYLKLLSAIDECGANVIFAEPGNRYSAGRGEFTVLAPLKNDYYEINDFSVVIRYVFGDTSFIFCGDAENVSENEILERFSPSELHSDVIKIGHHGSSTSTGEVFLSAISPEYAVIECATPNFYGHPNYETLSLLDKFGITCMRTDYDGNITFRSDGETVILLK